MNIPNGLTVLRLSLIPFMVIFYYLPFKSCHLAASLIFIFACMTDFLDGLLARLLKQTSALGAFLDPVADKLLIAVALVILVGNHHLPYIAIPAAIIVGREIVISALREWMAEIGKRASVTVSIVGKVKTFVQMLAIVFLLAYQPVTLDWPKPIGYVLLYFSAVLTIVSMVLYLKVAWPDLTLESKQQ